MGSSKKKTFCMNSGLPQTMFPPRITLIPSCLSFQQKYQILYNIGGGATSQVFAVFNRMSHGTYACKMIHKSIPLFNSMVDTNATPIPFEVYLMYCINHPNTIK